MVELKPLNHTGTVRLETERLVLRPTSLRYKFKKFRSKPLTKLHKICYNRNIQRTARRFSP